MSTALKLTVVIRGPVYAGLLLELSRFPDPLERAGVLKRLADEGARAARAGSAGDRVADLHGGLSELQDGNSMKPLDIRVAIQRTEFPALHAVLEGESNARARASLFRRLAQDALRGVSRRRPVFSSGSPRVAPAPTPPLAEGASLKLLSLQQDALPQNFIAGFGGGIDDA
jgi:hypothetical protein